MNDKQLQSRFEEMVQEAEEIIKHCGFTLPSKLTIKLNGRFTAKLGQCKVTPTKQYTIDIAKIYFIEYLNAGQPERIMDTILHEMCHALPDGTNHGEGWKKYTRVVNMRFGFNITTSRDKDEIINKALENNYPTVSFVCTKCGYSMTVKKNSKVAINIDLYKHKNCGGGFIKNDMGDFHFNQYSGEGQEEKFGY